LWCVSGIGFDGWLGSAQVQIFLGDPALLVVRGFIPDRLRSSRESSACGVSDVPGLQVLGPLRSPTGINPLATGFVVCQLEWVCGVSVEMGLWCVSWNGFVVCQLEWVCDVSVDMGLWCVSGIGFDGWLGFAEVQLSEVTPIPLW
jgi:hypothetical protein